MENIILGINNRLKKVIKQQDEILDILKKKADNKKEPLKEKENAGSGVKTSECMGCGFLEKQELENLETQEYRKNNPDWQKKRDKAIQETKEFLRKKLSENRANNVNLLW